VPDAIEVMKKRKRDGRRIDERTIGKDDYGTPEWFIKLVAKLDRRGIGLDVAAAKRAPINRYARKSFALWRHENALHPSRSWRGYGLTFDNPPYGTELPKFADKTIAEFGDVQLSSSDQHVMLVPGRGGSRWYKRLWRNCDAMLLCDRRFTFVGETLPAKFPQAVFYFGTSTERFLVVMGHLGTVMVADPVLHKADDYERPFLVYFSGEDNPCVRVVAKPSTKPAKTEPRRRRVGRKK
jgi:hypothetical protein